MDQNLTAKLTAYIDSHEQKMLQLWEQLVRIESPSHDKPGVDAVGEVVSRFCKEILGYNVRTYKDETYGNCIAACSVPFESWQDGIVLSAHMDTVHALGSFDPVFCKDETYFYGPGAGDCKGGIVMILLIAAALQQIGYSKRPIKLLFAGDEESGGPTGGRFYPEELKNSFCMFNAESGLRGKMVTGRKSSLIAVYDITGEAGHIGYLHDIPKSAIREAAKKLLALEDASDYDMLTFCGSMIDGGHAATSVSDRCRLHVNVRIKDSSVVDKAISILEDTAQTVYVPGTSCKLEIRGNRTPMSQREGNLLLCRKLSDASKALGYGPLEPVFVGGASDSAYASALEIPVVCATGPVVDFQHTRNERAVFSSMAQRAKIHCLTILNLPEI